MQARHWAHLDIAGVMDNSASAIPYLNKGMSGMTSRFLLIVEGALFYGALKKIGARSSKRAWCLQRDQSKPNVLAG